MRGYFTEGAAIGDPVVLRGLAVQAGLDDAEVAAMLTGDAFGAAVRADERRAGQLGVHAVPHFVVDGRLTLSGAVPTEQLAAALVAAAQDRG